METENHTQDTTADASTANADVQPANANVQPANANVQPANASNPPSTTTDFRFVPQLDSFDPNFRSHARKLERLLQFEFPDLPLLREAFVGQRAPLVIHDKPVHAGNQKLAMLGDAALRIAYLDGWFWDDSTCSQIGQKMSHLASNLFLAKLGYFWDLEEMVVDIYGEPLKPVDVIDMASFVEAILGVVWVVSGNEVQEVKRVMNNLAKGYMGEDVCTGDWRQ
ncbi:hypothetical protein PRZ48_011109 [Zasmidium cellare]|uniref:RNase III domain-containing protein n=1 Tax=Zasmidium cellare TaxID=395010 RepID=A0ABR0EAH8_ZASCE|nr:hypothetical protein PRZ48_011109 [Zasmidium cellare]